MENHTAPSAEGVPSDWRTPLEGNGKPVTAWNRGPEVCLQIERRRGLQWPFMSSIGGSIPMVASRGQRRAVRVGWGAKLRVTDSVRGSHSGAPVGRPECRKRAEF